MNRLVPVAAPNQSAPSHASGPKRRWAIDSNSAALGTIAIAPATCGVSSAPSGGNSTLYPGTLCPAYHQLFQIPKPSVANSLARSRCAARSSLRGEMITYAAAMTAAVSVGRTRRNGGRRHRARLSLE